MKANPIPEDVGDFLYYDESSPSGLRWKVSRGGTAKKGSVVGTLGETRPGYARWQTKVRGAPLLCSRIVWALAAGSDVPMDMEVDHCNGDSTDNRVGNLRAVVSEVNCRNQKIRTDNVTGVQGVTYEIERNLYQAYVRVPGGKLRTKTFYVNKWGGEAKQLAISWRQEKLLELNAQGAGYSDRHLQNSGIQL